MNKKYFIRQYSFNEFQHGWIGYADAEKIFLKNGFEPLVFPCNNSFSLTSKLARFYSLLKFLFKIPRGSVIVFLFPVFARMNQLLLKLLARKKGIKLICMIGDVEGLRDDDQELLTMEIKQLRSFNFFIVHNEKMRLWLGNLNPQCRSCSIYFFDYLAGRFYTERSFHPRITFAGNLAKSNFLNDLYLLHKNQPLIHFNLYGPGITEEIKNQQNVTYCGAYDAYKIPELIQGSFGLIWDGLTINTCAGGYGSYLHINTQHKLSLYIVSGMPVIIWEDAATAELIKKYNIGITISSLHEIGDKLKGISAADYNLMRENMIPLADKISQGYYLSNALENLTSQGDSNFLFL